MRCPGCHQIYDFDFTTPDIVLKHLNTHGLRIPWNNVGPSDPDGEGPDVFIGHCPECQHTFADNSLAEVITAITDHINATR